MANERSFSLGGDDDNGTIAELGGSAGGSGGADSLGAVAFGDNDIGGSDGLDDHTYDPERHISRDRRNADGSYRRKRRRKDGSIRPSAGTKRTQKGSDYSASLDALSNTLMIVHAGVASVTKIPEIEIDKDESKALANGVANVLAEFDIQPDPKAQAIIGLIIAAGSIYGPRMYLYNERMKEQRKARNTKPVMVHPMGGIIEQ
jgi:hypothetical protein